MATEEKKPSMSANSEEGARAGVHPDINGIHSIPQQRLNFNSDKFDLSMLKNVKGSNKQYTASCPAHEDRHSSLSVRVDGDRVLLHCHAGCSTEDVIGALGLPMSALFLGEKSKNFSSHKRHKRRSPKSVGDSLGFVGDLPPFVGDSLGKNDVCWGSVGDSLGKNDVCWGSVGDSLGKNDVCWGSVGDSLGVKSSESESDSKSSIITDAEKILIVASLDGLQTDTSNPTQPDKSLKPYIKNTITYEYQNPDGTLVYRKKRYEYSDGSKTFCFFTPDGTKGANGLKRVPFNLPAVLTADTVYFVEGEKAAKAIIKAGRVATTLDAGANSRWLPEYSGYFVGKEVIILPDNDAPGMKYARMIAKYLPNAIIVKLPDLPDKGDVYDWLAAGHTIEEIDALPCEELEEPDEPTTLEGHMAIAVNFLPIEPNFIDVNPFEGDKAKYYYRWDDIGISNLFADCYKNVSRYVPEANAWYVYDGRVWKQDIGGVLVANQAKRFMYYLLFSCQKYINDDDTRGKWIDFVFRRIKKSARDTMLADAASCWPVSLMEFDKDPYVFNCRNCTLDLRTFKAKEHNPSDFLSKVSNVAYDEQVRCERWESFISEIMQGDVETARFLQKALGYALTGDTSEECFFILYGSTTRNGKGTTMETTLHMLGEYGRTAQPETIAQRQTTHNGGPTEDIARLKGARFVNMSEPDKGLRLNSALVKQVTGGDTVTARFLHQNSFEYRPEYKLFINTNHLPRVSDDSVFASGRVKLIPFERHFEEVEQDKGLKEFFKRDKNISGIFNWFLEGLRLMQVEGLRQPKAVAEAIARYREESDVIGQFIKECLTEVKREKTLVKDVYTEYEKWCEENGCGALAKNNLTTELRKKGLKVERSNFGKTYLFNYGIVYTDDLPKE